jgi:lipopolysaccharide transport system permease protein
MKTQSAGLLFSHRQLLWRVTLNEMAARYAGSLLGLGWVVLSPLLFLAIYSVVYLYVFRVQVAGLSPVGYVLYIFAGLVPFLATSEALATGVTSVVANKSILNNTVFPVDLVPAKAVLMSQGTMIVGLAVIIVTGFVARTLTWTVLLLPVVWGLHILALVGLNWILSLLNVIFRDLQNLIGAALMILLVASPIAYTPEMVPSTLKGLVVVNPFSYFVIAYQRLLVLGEIPGLGESVVLVVVSLGLFASGSRFFAGAKRVIVDYV